MQQTEKLYPLVQIRDSLIQAIRQETGEEPKHPGASRGEGSIGEYFDNKLRSAKQTISMRSEEIWRSGIPRRRMGEPLLYDRDHVLTILDELHFQVL